MNCGKCNVALEFVQESPLYARRKCPTPGCTVSVPLVAVVLDGGAHRPASVEDIEKGTLLRWVLDG
jgi:hypothetical protein